MPNPRNDNFFTSLRFRYGVALFGFLLIGGYFLWAEHQAHIMLAVPYLPFLLILLCPLMHLFMHHGHGGHGDHGSADGDQGEQRHSHGPDEEDRR